MSSNAPFETLRELPRPLASLSWDDEEEPTRTAGRRDEPSGADDVVEIEAEPDDDQASTQIMRKDESVAQPPPRSARPLPPPAPPPRRSSTQAPPGPTSAFTRTPEPAPSSVRAAPRAAPSSSRAAVPRPSRPEPRPSTPEARPSSPVFAAIPAAPPSVPDEPTHEAAAVPAAVPSSPLPLPPARPPVISFLPDGAPASVPQPAPVAPAQAVPPATITTRLPLPPSRRPPLTAALAPSTLAPGAPALPPVAPVLTPQIFAPIVAAPAAFDEEALTPRFPPPAPAPPPPMPPVPRPSERPEAAAAHEAPSIAPVVASVPPADAPRVAFDPLLATASPLFTLPPPPILPREATATQISSSRRGAPSPWSKVAAVLGAMSLVISLTLAVFVLWPRQGHLRIELSGTVPSRTEIFVDGHKRCDTVPCVVRDLPPGPKTIQVAGNGVLASPVSEVVESGKERTVTIAVGSSGPVGALKVAGSQPGVKLFVDGTDRGPLPATVRDLSAGSHVVVLDGGDRFQKLEKTVEVAPGQTVDLGEPSLALVRGMLTVELGTPGTSLTLLSRDGRQQKSLPGPFPMTIELTVADGWRLHGVKRGHRDFDLELAFEDGLPERRVRVELTEEVAEPANAPPVVAVAAAPAKAPAALAAKPEAPAEPAPAAAAPAAKGPGTLNINSLPPSKVLVDGRPSGSTPLVDISLPAGPHTVTFIHPELGKKTVTVEVQPGQRAVAAVRFPKPE